MSHELPEIYLLKGSGVPSLEIMLCDAQYIIAWQEATLWQVLGNKC